MNLANVEDLNRRLIIRDMKRIFLVTFLAAGLDLTLVGHVADMWINPYLDLLNDWEQIDWYTACYWQYSLNKLTGKLDRQSNKLDFLLIYNLCTTDLRDQINLKYETLPLVFKGSITYCWALFYTLFTKSRDTTAALKKYLQFFSIKGLQCVRNESVVIAKKEIMAVCKQLYAADDFPEETTIDISKGLQKCSVKCFCDLLFFSYSKPPMHHLISYRGAELGGMKMSYRKCKW